MPQGSQLVFSQKRQSITLSYSPSHNVLALNPCLLINVLPQLLSVEHLLTTSGSALSNSNSFLFTKLSTFLICLSLSFNDVKHFCLFLPCRSVFYYRESQPRTQKGREKIFLAYNSYDQNLKNFKSRFYIMMSGPDTEET